MSRSVAEEVVGVNVLSEVIDFVSSQRFQWTIERFKAEYAHLFDDLAEYKSPELQEQRLECYEAFTRFQALIEALFEDFNAQHGLTTAMLLESCRHAIESDFMPLFEEDPNKAFVEDVLLSWLDYDRFVAMICEDRRNRASTPQQRHK